MLRASPILSFNLKDTFASLKYPNYRIWFVGQLISLVGTWTQSAAQGYLVFELTQSPAYLGYVGFAAGLPSWFFTLYAGVIADRVSRRTMLVVTQSVMMVLAFILAALAFTGVVQPWHIILLAFCLGIANAFDAPARQAFVVEMVDRESLTNAIALNSAMFTSATVVGPAVGGLAYAWFGPGWCFTVNGVTFVAVILALALMKLKPNPTPARKAMVLQELRTGLSYVASNATIRMLILNMGAITLFGFGMVTLIPAWAVNILEGDATTNGWLLSARGLGSLAGALMIAALGSRNARGKLWTWGSFVLPVLMLVFAGIRWLPLSLLTMMGIGWAFMALINTTNALVQTLVPDELRGRVMGFYMLVFFGSYPLGSLLSGTVAGYLGEPLTLVLGGLCVLAFAGLVWWRMPRLRELS